MAEKDELVDKSVSGRTFKILAKFQNPTNLSKSS